MTEQSMIDRMRKTAFAAWAEDNHPPSEWRVEPAVGVELLNARDREGNFLVQGPSGDCTFLGMPVISDPDIEGFALVPRSVRST